MTKARLKIDQERLEKKQQGEAKEYLDTITQADEAKAADAIIETQHIAEKEANEDKARKIEALEKSRQWTRAEYVHRLAETLNEMAKHMDLPAGYTYWVGFNDKKLNLIITAPSGKKFGRGIIPTGSTTYDFHAIGVLVTQAENTIDYIEERGQYNKSGIIV